jgi:hypothetical protein
VKGIVDRRLRIISVAASSIRNPKSTTRFSKIYRTGERRVLVSRCGKAYNGGDPRRGVVTVAVTAVLSSNSTVPG